MSGPKASIELGSDGKAVSPQPTPRISVLIDATGEGSLYLSRTIMGLLARTNTKRLTTEFLIMVNEEDDWNRETIEFFQAYMKTIEFLIGFAPVLEFVRIPENKDPYLGDGYVINQLATLSRGEWILPMRASQVIRTAQWDERLIELVEGTDSNSARVSTIKMDVQGVPDQKTGVAFAVSRGWYDSLGHVVKHAIAEDYIALVVDKIGDPNRSLYLDDIEILDPEWGSIERSLPEATNGYLVRDVSVLTDRIKEGR